MKQYKQFRSEQQYITEVGPLLGMITGLLGLAGVGYAGFKTAKAGIDKWKGYKESQAEKKANEASGVEIEVKKINPETGEQYEEYIRKRILKQTDEEVQLIDKQIEAEAAAAPPEEEEEAFIPKKGNFMKEDIKLKKEMNNIMKGVLSES